jgi:dCMP deaminase
MPDKTWDRRFIDLARHIAGWSKDPSTQVGAVIALDRRVISIGYNGFPRGIQDSHERLHARPQKYTLTVHAELNALLNASARPRGATLYTWPLSPCQACALQIIQAGIARVVAPYADESLWERWSDSLLAADALFAEAGILLDLLDRND